MATCDCKPPIPPRPPRRHPFPAMSAHFSHTLDDLVEHYVQAQYFEITGDTGVFAEKDLKTLLESRSNLLVYQGKVFRFSKSEGDLHKYVNASTNNDSDLYTFQQITVNGKDGSWKISDLLSSEVEVMKTEFNTFQTKVNEDIANINETMESLKVDGGEIK